MSKKVMKQKVMTLCQTKVLTLKWSQRTIKMLKAKIEKRKNKKKKC